MEGRDRGLISGTLQAFRWWNLEEDSRTLSSKINDVQFEI
jgi:hypothetical protein